MFFRRNKTSVLLACAISLVLLRLAALALGQTATASQEKPSPVGRYIDQTSGRSADDVVAYALTHNLELQAAHKEIDAAKAMIKQAQLRANPKVDIDVGGMLPLELGGRRSARITVAEREVEVRERQFANRERLLAAEVRMKFGETLAQSLKLSLTDERIESSQQSFNLVAARVSEGATPPLEQNMVLVELNRLRSQRESVESKLETLILELRNLIGMPPEEPLRLRGDFNHLVDQLPPIVDATNRALRERPDLLAARAIESWADARIEQARAEGRLDASLSAGYEHMTFGFPVRGVDDSGRLQRLVFHLICLYATRIRERSKPP